MQSFMLQRGRSTEVQNVHPAVMKAIVATGYKGFVGQEFEPTGNDPLGSLERCVRICDV
jgi:hydroxypyruvate isomerase